MENIYNSASVSTTIRNGKKRLYICIFTVGRLWERGKEELSISGLQTTGQWVKQLHLSPCESERQPDIFYGKGLTYCEMEKLEWRKESPIFGILKMLMSNREIRHASPIRH
jgi:hypothetical protein